MRFNLLRIRRNIAEAAVLTTDAPITRWRYAFPNLFSLAWINYSVIGPRRIWTRQ
jgi:hypothetical protein